MLIEADNLSRRFDQRLAVESVSFKLAPGQLLALLGPNGAGKTTTMRMLCGLLAPTGGSARICGHALAQQESENDRIRAHCGVVPEAAGFYERLSARDNLRFFGGLQGLDRSEIETRASAGLARFGLADRGDDRAGTFSKGMKQRLSLARALLHEPALLFLDEPTAGLDPKATADLHDLLRELKAGGTGIVLSTHSLEEAESLADELLVLDTRTLFQGRPSDLLREAHVEVEVELAAPLQAAVILPEGVGHVARGSGLLDAGARVAAHPDPGPSRPWPLPQEQERVLRFTVIEPARDIPLLVRALVAVDAEIVRVGRLERGLRERYLDLLGPR